jgi:glycerate 2-kinase
MGNPTIQPRKLLKDLFAAAVQAADPMHCLQAHLPPPPKGRTVVVGAGKGVAQLAAALEQLWPTPVEGTVVTRYGYAAACARIELLEAAHPVPDEAGLAASKRLFERVSGLTEDDLVVALICGGGSALLPAPPHGFGLDDEIELNHILLKSGAPISVMNALRKQFSLIKGGRLAAAAAPARVVSLVVSDIPGDNPAFVASGPTIADATTPAEALQAADQYRIGLPPRIRAHIEQSVLAWTGSTPQSADNSVRIIASAGVSLEAAAAKARAQGIEAVILSDAIEGEAREAGLFHAALALEIEKAGRPFSRPVVLLSGGETTVTVRGAGRGGRNTEFLLSFASRIAGARNIHALVADTDGIDGTEDNAGAFADGTTAARLLQKGLQAGTLLAGNDAWSGFAAIDDLFVTGPTGTNVNDFRAILIA